MWADRSHGHGGKRRRSELEPGELEPDETQPQRIALMGSGRGAPSLQASCCWPACCTVNPSGVFARLPPRASRNSHASQPRARSAPFLSACL